MRKLILTSLLIFLIPMAFALVAASPDYQGLQRFREILVTGPANFDGAVDFDDTVNFAGATVSDLTLADNLTVAAGGLTVTEGDLTLSDGDLTVADYAIVTAQSLITLTDAGVLTPTGSYQPISAAGNVTVTLAACSQAGAFYTFVNVNNVAIVITDTGDAVLSGNATLGQYDALQMLCDGTRMIQIAPESDN